MKCLSCSRSAVMALQHGSLCPAHFIDYFEEKVFKTIKKYRMIENKIQWIICLIHLAIIIYFDEKIYYCRAQPKN